MSFQQRDGAILRMIYANEGVVAKRQIKAMFWTGKSKRTMEIRLAKLHKAGYIDWPSFEQRRLYPIPEPICWLDWKGAMYLASSLNLNIEPPTKNNETQLRRFQKNLRECGIRWVRQPRWSLLRHDLAVADIKIEILRITNSLSRFSLQNWIPESAFRAETDEVMVEIEGKDGKKRSYSKGICPDACFEIIEENRLSHGEPARARFLVEMDMATHDNNSFGREKIIPGVSYILSEQYCNRFGDNNGSWLIITSGGNTRLKNLIDQAKEKSGTHTSMFFFTSLDRISKGNLFIDPIWFKAEFDEPMQLFPQLSHG